MESSGSGTAEQPAANRPVQTQKEKLREILGAGRPSWSAKDLAAAESKLQKVGASSVFQLKTLLDAPPETGLNQRLRDAGLKAFGPETLAALREQLAKPCMAPYLRKSRAAKDIPRDAVADQAPAGSPSSVVEEDSPAKEMEDDSKPQGAAAGTANEGSKPQGAAAGTANEGSKPQEAAAGTTNEGSQSHGPEAVPPRAEEREDDSKPQETAAGTTNEGSQAAGLQDAVLTASGIEVRSVPGRGFGLFATRRFAAGEVVLEEKPFWTRPQPEEVKAYKALFTPEWAEAFTRIKEPLPYPGEDAEANIFASPAMVRNALGYGKASPSIRRKILQLHQPELDCGHPIVAVAGRVAALCIKHLKVCKDVDQVELQRAILAVEMNIFAGGRCFATFSRLNHSCFPNAVYISMKQKWCFKALRDIDEGEELLHSYLGKELLLPTEIRRRLLWRSKCFECACDRCAATADTMRVLPCRWCGLEQASLTVAHAPGIWMRAEPSKYGSKKAFLNKGTTMKVAGSVDTTDWLKDDWVKVNHAEKGDGWVLVHGRSLDTPLGVLVVDSLEQGAVVSEGPDDKQTSSYWTSVVDFLAATNQVGAAMLDEEDRDDHVELLSDTIADRLWLPSYTYGVGENATPCVRFQEGSWRCERCQRSQLQEEMLLATERLAGRLAECTFFSPTMTPALGGFSGKNGGLKMVKKSFLQKALDLAVTVTGVLGRRHWCYHWAQILFVDLIITRIQYSNGRRIDAGGWFLLEMLYDLWEWLSSLGMAQDPGCFLHGRVTEALRRLAHAVGQMDDLSRWRFQQLKERVDACTTQIEILPLRPLIIDGTVSFQ